LLQLLRQAGKLPWIAVRENARVHESTFGPQRTDSIDLCQNCIAILALSARLAASPPGVGRMASAGVDPGRRTAKEPVARPNRWIVCI
jgi:hypothetical protein